jgi:hypothetical protein
VGRKSKPGGHGTGLVNGWSGLVARSTSLIELRSAEVAGRSVNDGMVD